MGGEHQPRPDGLVQRPVGGQTVAGGQARHLAVEPSDQLVVERTAQLRQGLANQEQPATLGPGIGLHHLGAIGQHPQRSHQQGAGDGHPVELVEQAVLARHERGSVGHRRVVAALGGSHQRTETVRQRGVTPTEVVQQRHPVRVRPHRHHVAEGFVDRGQRHAIRVETPVPRVDAQPEGEGGLGGFPAFQGDEDHAVGGSLGGGTTPGPHQGAAANLVIEGGHDVGLGGHRGQAKQGQQAGVGFRHRQRRGRSGNGKWRRERGGLPGGHQRTAGAALVEERHGQIHHGDLAVVHSQAGIAGEGADGAHLAVPTSAQLDQGVDMLRRYGQHHAFLGLGQPQLPRGQAGVLARHQGQIDPYPHLGAQLAHRRAQAARPAVGQGPVEPRFTGVTDDLHGGFFGDGITDLHGRAGQLGGLRHQLSGGEGGPVDAVAAGSTAQHHHYIACVGPDPVAAVGHQTNRPAVHQRVPEIAGVVDHRPSHGGQAQLVAVVPDAGDDPLGYPGRGQHARWDRIRGGVRRSEAQHVETGDGPGRHPNNIADDPTYPGVGPAEGFQGGGMVVGFDFDGQIPAIIEGNNAGVVHESGAHPVLGRLVRRRPQVGGQQPVDLLMV